MDVSRRDLLRSVALAGVAAAPGCSSEADPPPPPPPPELFRHGVASGDPLPDRVVLWTRVSVDVLDEPPAGEVVVDWEVATDPGLTQVVASGQATTSSDRDHTVKVDAGGLQPGTTYYYRFTALEITSPPGRTRTLPVGPTPRARLAVLSCQSYQHGFYAVHRHLAGRADVDAVLFLGDFIYEYGVGEYGMIRAHQPPTECLTLADYRTRYAQYRRDPDLRASCQQHAFLCVWDDHEFADNTNRDGGGNHDPATEGEWTARRDAAAQAYLEWMPIREDAEPRKIWRQVAFGDLVDLYLLDTRVWGRDPQIEDPMDPAIADPARQMMGEDQEQWLFGGLATSTAKWKVIGQQVMLMHLPLGFGAFAGGDSWDGYPAAQQRLWDAISGVQDVVVLTGDIHMSFAADLAPDLATYDPATGAGSLGVEFVTPGVSSPGAPFPIEFENVHIHFVDSFSRGYIVLDVTPAKVQAAYYHLLPTAQDETVEDPENLAVEQTRTFSVASGTAHVVEDASPDAPPADPPALAAPAIERPEDWPIGYV